ncbi:hypothetical protein XENOCAPTIV_007436, partial [Xenoophorus captivus]
LWIRRHSWQMRTWLQVCRKLRGGAGGASNADTGGGGGVHVAELAPNGSSKSLCGPGPKSGPAAISAPSPAKPPVRGPAPL